MIKRTLKLFLALLFCFGALPAAAQDGIGYWSVAGSAVPTSATYSTIGVDANGEGTVITAFAANNTKGVYTQISPSTSGNWTGFTLVLQTSSAAANRYLIDVSFDGGITVALADVFYVSNLTTAGQAVMYFPLRVPAGSNFQIRMQSSSASATLRVAVVGEIGQSGLGYATCDNLLAGTNARASTLAGDTTVTMQNSGSQAWTQLIASTASTYQAFWFTGSITGGTLANIQRSLVKIGVGAAASEVQFIGLPWAFSSTSPYAARNWNSWTYFPVSSGSRISASILTTTGGSDAIRIGVIGCR